MMVGEIYLPVEKLMTYYGTHGGEASAVQFSIDQVTLERESIATTIRRMRPRCRPTDGRTGF